MPTTPQRETAKFIEAFERYFTEGMVHRNLDAITDMLSSEFYAFGTGGDETITSKEQGVELFRRDFLAAPNPLDYTLHYQKIRVLDKNTALIMAELDLKTQIMEQEIRLNNLRLTLILHDEAGTVKVAGHHISFPTVVHDEDEPYPLKELEERAHVLQRMVEERTKTLEEAYLEMAEMIHKDGLTGLASRYSLEQCLEAEHQRYLRFSRPYSVIVLDLDDFKHVNDSCGHTAGDEVLKECGQLLNSHSRITDTVGRWGGDEFVLVLSETDLEAAEALARRILPDAASHCWSVDHPVFLSIGVASVREGVGWQDVFAEADSALYKAKKQGKRCVVVAAGA